jgi:hypothetical protein
MSQQDIYTIQLLNDLHNHFPDILYNPGRFNNVQDLLLYIRTVANDSPYQRGYRDYSRQVARRTQTVPQIISTVIDIPATVPLQSIPLQSSTTRTTPVQASVRTTTRQPAPQTNLNSLLSNNQILINTLLGGMFGDLLDVPIRANLQDFLNERVPVRPSVEQIENATLLYTTTRNLEDICAICQDTIEIGQEVRKLHHCLHSFHRECIDTWFLEDVHCPTCRHDIREVEQNAPPPVSDTYRRTNIRQPEST